MGSWVLDLQPRGQRGDGCICRWSWCLGTRPREPVGLQRAPVLASAASASAGEGPPRRCCPFCWEGGDGGEHPGVVQTRSPWEPGSRLQEGMSRGPKARAWGLPDKAPTFAHWGGLKFKRLLRWRQLSHCVTADLRECRPIRWPSQVPSPLAKPNLGTAANRQRAPSSYRILSETRLMPPRAPRPLQPVDPEGGS